ncbi:MAG: hypothetical protein R2690_04760 [Acidimicrobiales bacterium]
MHPSTEADHNLVAAPVGFVGGTPDRNIIDLPPFFEPSPRARRASTGRPDSAPSVDFRAARPLDGDDDGVAAVDIGPLESPPLGGFHAVQPFRLFDSREGKV